MVTLAELAAAQQSSGKNPWLAQSSQGTNPAPPPPDNSNDEFAGANTLPGLPSGTGSVLAGSVLGGLTPGAAIPGSIYGAIKGDQYHKEAEGQDKERKAIALGDLPDTNGLSSPPGAANEGGHATSKDGVKLDKEGNKVPGAVLQGSGKAPLSAEEQWLIDTKGISEDQIQALHDQGKTADEIADIYLGKRQPSTMPGVEGARSGGVLQRVDELQQNRDMADQASALQIKLTGQHALADANQSAANNLSEAQKLRDTKPDPNHWFKERGVAGSILAAISIGAGAFAAAMPHTENHTNQALGIINGAIDRDIAAQKDEIDNKWKALDYKGKEDDKKFTRAQFGIEQLNQAKLTDWNHAGTMIDHQLTSANNQVAVVNLQKIRTEVRLKEDEVKQQMADHRRDVAIILRTRAAAAASAGSFTPREIAAKKWELEKDPNFQPLLKGQDRADAIDAEVRRWADPKGSYGPGGTVTKGGAPVAGSEGEKSLEDLLKTGTAVAGETSGAGGLGHVAVSHLPGSSYYSPTSSKVAGDLSNWNDNMLPTAQRLVGDRVPPEMIQKAVDASKLVPGESQQVALQKVARFHQSIRTFLSMPAKNKALAPEE